MNNSQKKKKIVGSAITSSKTVNFFSNLRLTFAHSRARPDAGGSGDAGEATGEATLSGACSWLGIVVKD